MNPFERATILMEGIDTFASWWTGCKHVSMSTALVALGSGHISSWQKNFWSIVEHNAGMLMDTMRWSLEAESKEFRGDNILEKAVVELAFLNDSLSFLIYKPSWGNRYHHVWVLNGVEVLRGVNSHAILFNGQARKKGRHEVRVSEKILHQETSIPPLLACVIFNLLSRMIYKNDGKICVKEGWKKSRYQFGDPKYIRANSNLFLFRDGQVLTSTEAKGKGQIDGLWFRKTPSEEGNILTLPYAITTQKMINMIGSQLLNVSAYKQSSLFEYLLFETPFVDACCDH